VIPALACLAFAAPASAAETEAVSQNWAGYEAASSSGNGFSAVSGGWTQPTAKCTAGEATYSAFWVGLGGGGGQSNALEQAGTQSDCTASGQAIYYAWYELVPSAPVKLGIKISPGDSIWTRVAVSGSAVTIQLSDRTTGQSVAKTVTMTGATPDTSTAEWIAEAPSACDGSTMSQCTPLPLADFGTVRFHNAYTTSNGHTGSVSDPNWSSEAIELSSQGAGGLLGGGYGGYGFGQDYSAYMSSSSAGAAPTSLSSDGTAFSVEYGAQASSASSTSGSGSSSYGYGGYGSDGYGGYGSSGGYGGYGGSYGYGGYGSDGYGGYGGYGYGGYGSDGYGGYGSYGGYGGYY
jgi:hypothetical protein